MPYRPGVLQYLMSAGADDAAGGAGLVHADRRLALQAQRALDAGAVPAGLDIPLSPVPERLHAPRIQLLAVLEVALRIWPGCDLKDIRYLVFAWFLHTPTVSVHPFVDELVGDAMVVIGITTLAWVLDRVQSSEASFARGLPFYPPGVTRLASARPAAVSFP